VQALARCQRVFRTRRHSSLLMTPAFLSRFSAQPGSIKNSFEEFSPISEVSARVMKKSCTQVECVSMLETVQHKKGMSGARLLLRAVITKRNKPRNFNSFRRRILECGKLTDISHKNSDRGWFLIIVYFNLPKNGWEKRSFASKIKYQILPIFLKMAVRSEAKSAKRRFASKIKNEIFRREASLRSAISREIEVDN